MCVCVCVCVCVRTRGKWPARCDPVASSALRLSAPLAGIVLTGSKKDARLRRVLLGPSVTGYLQKRSPIPVLSSPSMDIHSPAGMQPSVSLRAMQARKLLQRPAALHCATASAA